MDSITLELRARFCALIQHDEMPSAALDQSGRLSSLLGNYEVQLSALPFLFALATGAAARGRGPLLLSLTVAPLSASAMSAWAIYSAHGANKKLQASLAVHDMRIFGVVGAVGLVLLLTAPRARPEWPIKSSLRYVFDALLIVLSSFMSAITAALLSTKNMAQLFAVVEEGVKRTGGSFPLATIFPDSDLANNVHAMRLTRLLGLFGNVAEILLFICAIFSRTASRYRSDSLLYASFFKFTMFSARILLLARLGESDWFDDADHQILLENTWPDIVPCAIVLLAYLHNEALLHSAHPQPPPKPASHAKKNN
eukprot:TRINITY_DN2254_c0_g1_i1.p1 TRINITY_DN2254_c0_g1~~TRINITY_DN2254_c0_g1_i1.p1  ORF type:complete len:311 (-),score=47.72 TRINITY_DN2254_c0_g1_i1:47-979(-)